VKPCLKLLYSQKKLDKFIFLRFWGAFLVIFSDSFAINMNNYNLEPLPILRAGAYNLGSLGRTIFFVISEFLIIMS
jgi:peptidoglycan/LPS O-acetylase OafA/YrhL